MDSIQNAISHSVNQQEQIESGTKPLTALTSEIFADMSSKPELYDYIKNNLDVSLI